VVNSQPHTHRTSNQPHPLLSPHWGRSIRTSPLQPFYNMPSRPNPLTPSPSNLSYTPTLALTHIINTSLPTDTFPAAFKQARVTPLLKKPTLNTSLTNSYRPVSLLPFITKTLERVVFNQVLLFLSQNNKLDANQSGLGVAIQLRLCYCQSQKPCGLKKLIINHQFLFCWIYLQLDLDLSDDFDTVNHQILLSALSSLDITGIPLHWFESYLTGRSFRVAWGGQVSKAH